MDSLTPLKELSTCGICFELFNEYNRCPKVLKCGHTFCHSCLEKLLWKSPSCPTCKAEIQSQKADLIPTNYVAFGLICISNQDIHPSETKNEDNQKRITHPITLKLESKGFCSEHSSDKQIRCMDCEVWICGTCSMLKHKQCRTLLAREAYKELKCQLFNKAGKELKARKSKTDNIEISLKYLEEERKTLIEKIRKYEIKLEECNMKMNNLNSLNVESNKFSESLRQIQTEAITIKNDAEISKLLNKFDDFLIRGKNWLTQLENLKLNLIFPTTLKELRKLNQNFQEVYVVDIENEPLYGKVTLMGEQIRISSFSDIKPRGLYIPYKEFLQNFNGSSDLPNMIYMKVKGNIDQVAKKVDVVIKTDEASPIVKNFVLLCSGLKRHTFKGRSLGDDYYSLQLSADLPPAVAGLIVETSTGPNSQIGSIQGVMGSKSRFSITLRKDYYKGPLIGNVISGLTEMQQFPYGVNYSCVIEDCGLVMEINHDKPSSGTKVTF